MIGVEDDRKSGIIYSKNTIMRDYGRETSL